MSVKTATKIIPPVKIRKPFEKPPFWKNEKKIVINKTDIAKILKPNNIKQTASDYNELFAIFFNFILGRLISQVYSFR